MVGKTFLPLMHAFFSATVFFPSKLVLYSTLKGISLDYSIKFTVHLRTQGELETQSHVSVCS